MSDENIFNNQFGAQMPHQYPQDYPGGYPYDPTPKKKSKLWLWITLAITIPLFLCIVGAIIFVAIGASLKAGLTQPIGATNNFYEALRDGESIEPYVCDDYSEIVFVDSGETLLEEVSDVDSYRFNSVKATPTDARATGTVTRGNVTRDAEVQLVKEEGKYKVCSVVESS